MNNVTKRPTGDGHSGITACILQGYCEGAIGWAAAGDVSLSMVMSWAIL